MDATPARDRRMTDRFATFSGLIAVVTLCGGCAQSPARSLARAWNDLPKVRWSTSGDAEEAESGDDAEIAENAVPHPDSSWSTFGRFRFPSLSNAAAGARPNADESPDIAKSHSGPHDPFLDDEGVDAGRASVASEVPGLESDEGAAAPIIASQRARLRAALSDDSRRSRQPDVDVAEQERLRVRIESLMIRATEHFKEGELEKAQRDAELAQRLADECSLEFAPDEDRPVDLLAKIVARLQSIAAAAAEANEAEDDTLSPEAGEDDVAILPNDSQEFDPYAERSVPPQPARQIFPSDSALVVLETPSFEEIQGERAVSHTAYSANAGIPPATAELAGERPRLRSPRIDQAMQAAALPPIESAATMSQPAPPPPELAGPTFGDADLSGANEEAPVPRDDVVVSRQRGTMTLDDIDDATNEETEDEEQMLAAQVVPKWRVLAFLSALAAAISIWLIRRRSLASF